MEPMNPAMTPDTQQPAQQDMQSEGSDQQPNPKEQEHYDKLVIAAMKVLYDDTTHEAVMKMLRTAAEHGASTALASVTAMILTQLDEKSGQKVPGNIVLPAAAEIMMQVAELAQAAKIFEPTEEDMATAMRQLTTVLKEKYKGEQQQPGMKQAGMEQQAGQPSSPVTAQPQTAQSRPGLINQQMGGLA